MSSLRSNKLKILLVEDCYLTVMMVEIIMKQENIDLVVATNGREALRILESEEHVFSLLLLDLNFPMGSPKKLIKVARERFSKTFPIIICSGTINISEIAKELGVTGHLSKPYSVDSLLMKILISLRENRDLKPLTETSF